MGLNTLQIKFWGKALFKVVSKMKTVSPSTTIGNKMKKNWDQYYLAVEAESEQHKEEKSCPERCQRHQSHSLGVGYECQTWTCMLGRAQWKKSFYYHGPLLQISGVKTQCSDYSKGGRIDFNQQLSDFYWCACMPLYQSAVCRMCSDCATHNSWLSVSVSERWGSDLGEPYSYHSQLPYWCPRLALLPWSPAQRTPRSPQRSWFRCWL